MYTTSASFTSLLLVLCAFYSSNAFSRTQIRNIMEYEQNYANSVWKQLHQCVGELSNSTRGMTEFLDTWRQDIVKQGAPAAEAVRCFTIWNQSLELETSRQQLELKWHAYLLLDDFYKALLNTFREHRSLDEVSTRMPISEMIRKSNNARTDSLDWAWQKLRPSFQRASQCLRSLSVQYNAFQGLSTKDEDAPCKLPQNITSFRTFSQ